MKSDFLISNFLFNIIYIIQQPQTWCHWQHALKVRKSIFNLYILVNCVGVGNAALSGIGHASKVIIVSFWHQTEYTWLFWMVSYCYFISTYRYSTQTERYFLYSSVGWSFAITTTAFLHRMSAHLNDLLFCAFADVYTNASNGRMPVQEFIPAIACDISIEEIQCG